MKQKHTDTKTRRPYNKPQIEQVELKAEEATLTACKFRIALPGGHAPAAGCTNPAGIECVDIGS